MEDVGEFWFAEFALKIVIETARRELMGGIGRWDKWSGGE